MKKRIVILILALGTICLLAGCCLSHEWAEATCETPKTCLKCEKTEGEALGHSWVDATCVDPKTCSVCAKTEGAALGHTPEGAEIRSYWVESENTTKIGLVETCAVCAAELPSEEVPPLVVGAWTGVQSEADGVVEDLADDQLFIEFSEDGTVFIMESQKGYFGTWELMDGFQLDADVTDIKNEAERVKGGEKIYWDQMATITLTSGGSVKARISGDNFDEMLIDLGDGYYYMTRGREISEYETTTAEVISGEWELKVVAFDAANYYVAADVGMSAELVFGADGSASMGLRYADVDEHFDGTWRYTRHYVSSGNDYYGIAANLDVTYQIVAVESPVELFDGNVPAGTCIGLYAGNQLMYFSPVNG